MNKEYIIVMNQFLNGGVENLFLTLAKIRTNDIFHLVILNNSYDRQKISTLPNNIKIINCFINNKYKRFFYFSKYIKKQLKNVSVMIDFHEVLQSELFMLYNSKKKICIHWFNSNPYMRLKKNKKDLYFNIYPFYKKTICICESQKIILQEVMPNILDSKFYVSNNFIDKEIVIEKAGSINPLQFHYFVMISRIDFGAKDFQTVIKAYEQLPFEIKRKYKMVFVGDGPDFDKLKSLINMSPDKEYFYLTGNQSNPYPYIKNAEIFIQSSLSEGFPLTTLEAWVIGCPVILSNFLCSAKELSSNETAALLFEIGNEKQLSEKIRLILKNKIIKEKLINDGKQRFEFYYNNGINSLNELFNEGVYK